MAKDWVTQENEWTTKDAMQISALKKIGLDELLKRVEQALSENLVALNVVIPYNANELSALYHARGIVEKENFTAKGTHIRGRISARLVEQFEDYIIDARRKNKVEAPKQSSRPSSLRRSSKRK